jgi:phenylalanyl-tRNA synthetase beta chain
MAGITSYGMLASAGELGLTGEAEGILILPQDVPVGVPLAEFLGGVVLDIETNPNRPDTLSMIGVARDVAALTQQQATCPMSLRPDPESYRRAAFYRRDDGGSGSMSALCSPSHRRRACQFLPWLRTRVEAAGMRPINLIVDLTNYVMLEFGQPLHAFDARQIQGETIVVRRACARELYEPWTV